MLITELQLSAFYPPTLLYMFLLNNSVLNTQYGLLILLMLHWLQALMMIFHRLIIIGVQEEAM